MQDQLLHKIRTLVDETVDGTSLYLVDLEIRGGKNQSVISVYLDSESGGISLDQCADVNRRLNLLIEAGELFSGPYTLNVSSPGLDRPLKDIRQYFNNKGRQVTIRYRLNENEEENQLSGKLDDVERDFIRVKSKDGKQHKLDFRDIIETKVKAVI